jgi:hypothetical protein
MSIAQAAEIQLVLSCSSGALLNYPPLASDRLGETFADLPVISPLSAWWSEDSYGEQRY